MTIATPGEHSPGIALSLSIKSVFTPKQQSRGSAHSKAFAAQTHKPVGLYPQKYLMRATGGRVPRFSYFKREKVSVWELSDVRVLRSQNTDCRKNDSFSTVSGTPSACLLFDSFRTSVFCEVRTQLVGKTKFFDCLKEKRDIRPRICTAPSRFLAINKNGGRE